MCESPVLAPSPTTALLLSAEVWKREGEKKEKEGGREEKLEACAEPCSSSFLLNAT